jgi:serine/threonine protein kinase
MAHAFPGFHGIERLYSSGRSAVDRVTRVCDARTVILKHPADGVMAADVLGRVQYEYDLLRAVSGPGVIEAFEIVRDGSSAALVLEDFGAELASCLAERRFPLAEALDVAIAITRSLAHVHAAGVIHRDVNPSNIVYDPATRTVKLIDFELATRARGSSAGAADSTVQGTLHYLAPEQTGDLVGRSTSAVICTRWGSRSTSCSPGGGPSRETTRSRSSMPTSPNSRAGSTSSTQRSRA